MAKTKEKTTNLSQPEKISEAHLVKMQELVNKLNRGQLEIGSVELRKHEVLHSISSLREDLTALQIEFKNEYGTFDVNITDGTINYPKENVETNS